jgi:hypothetical protein
VSKHDPGCERSAPDDTCGCRSRRTPKQHTSSRTPVERMKAADKTIKIAKAEYAAALAIVREQCEHKTLLEAPWEASRSGLFAPLQDLRICEDCGVEEERPFRVLTGRAYPAARQEIYRARKRGGRYIVGGSK